MGQDQEHPRTNPNADNAAGGVALGWVPFGFIFAFCLPFCFVGTCWNTPLVLELADKT